uniref:Ymf100 n=1 Tax=Plasmopara halstedii TaxID=4781 RepID=UPI0020287C02|nr:Ymf100 [Plasmopara halstedii]DAZ89091.1 TPA_asm: Ymf100 [Plasmopara halstedii]
MKKNKKIFQQNKKFNNKQNLNFKKYNKYPYFYKKKNRNFYKNNDIYYILGEKRPSKPLITAYLHRNKKIKTGIFFKKPVLKNILYPFHLNLKLINEYFKKK